MEEETKTQGYGKRPMWQWVVIYLLVAAVVYGLFYYFVLAKKGTSYNQPQTNTYQNSSPTTAPTTSTTEAAKVTIVGNEFAFTPSTFTAKKGQAVEVTFKNEGKYPHNLTIAGLDAASKTIQPGEEDSFTFTSEKTGTFSFTCTVDSHADKGMTGTLTVE